jgi:uncharacterized delta-60 repeat protein
MRRWRKSRSIVPILFAVVVLGLGGEAAAGDGALDQTFSGDGRVITSVQKFSGARDVAIQANGKIVVAGFSTGGGENHFAIVRYTANGGRDASFGGDGEVATDVRGGGGARAVAIQSNDKIVAAGHALVGQHDRFAVVRYKLDGSLDRTFGDDGRVTTAFGANAQAFALAVQRNGKIVVAGTSYGRHDAIALARYRPNGHLDPTFSSDGTLRTHIGSAAEGSDVAIGRNGRIVVAGSARVRDRSRFAVTKYRRDGSLARAFSGNGKITTRFGTDDAADAVVVRPDGKIVVAGSCELPTDNRGYRFALARYRLNGSLDPTFGAGGKVTTTFGDTDANAFALVRLKGGKVVAIGRSGAIGGFWRFALSRYRLDGRRDRTFGKDGRVLTGIANNAIAFGGALQRDGDIVAVGEAFVNGHNRFVGARYVG